MKHLSFLIKPASSLCNMRCRYCFYADVSDHRQVKSYGMMSEETVKALLFRVKEAAPDEVTFAFQGGEPTLAGLGFFQTFVAAVKEALPRVTVHYSIQTNGILLDDAFVAFLKEHAFLVGLSLDGDKDLHNYLRKGAKGEDTFSKVLAAYRRLREALVDVNILTVITAPLAKKAAKLWQFYRKHGMEFVQCIPCLDALDETDRPDFALTPRLYEQFLNDFFALWAKALQKHDYVSVRLFDNLIRQVAGETPEMCGMCGRCSPQFVIEADGSVYPCDFYVLDEFSCGNIHENTLDEILKSEAMQRFLSPLLEKACADCRFSRFCRGGCKRYRAFYLREDGYCPYAAFLEHNSVAIVNCVRYVFSR